MHGKYSRHNKTNTKKNNSAATVRIAIVNIDNERERERK